MNRYVLYVKENDVWQFVASIEAPTHSDAFRMAIPELRREYYHSPIRLEQEHSAGPAPGASELEAEQLIPPPKRPSSNPVKAILHPIFRSALLRE